MEIFRHMGMLGIASNSPFQECHTQTLYFTPLHGQDGSPRGKYIRTQNYMCYIIEKWLQNSPMMIQVLSRRCLSSNFHSQCIFFTQMSLLSLLALFLASYLFLHKFWPLVPGPPPCLGGGSKTATQDRPMVMKLPPCAGLWSYPLFQEFCTSVLTCDGSLKFSFLHASISQIV